MGSVSPVCPRCRRPACADEFRKVIGEHVWHERCHESWLRDREWLSEHEAEGAFE